MKYQNDPTKPDYNPSPQEQFRFGYNFKFGVCLAFAAILNTAHIFFTEQLKSLNGAGIWFSVGADVLLLTYAAYNMIKFFSLAKNPEKLEELYRRHTDERNAMIREKVAGGSFTAAMYIICAAMVIFAYISTLTAFVLAGLLLAMLIIRVLLKIYYERKY